MRKHLKLNQYICEFCNEGEMKYNPEISKTVLLNSPNMYNHICTKCGKTMLLPKMYPYIEWTPEEDDHNDN